MSNYCKECFERQEKIDRLEWENKELKEKKDEYYLINLDYEAKISYLIQALEEIREMFMCEIYNLNENDSQLSYMCNALDEFEKIRIKALTKINEVLNVRD